MTTEPDKILKNKMPLDGKEPEPVIGALTDDLDGPSGNAFMIMGQFQKDANRQGFDPEWTASILEECKQGDYENLCEVISNNYSEE